MQTLTNTEVSQVSAGIHLSHKIIGGLVGAVASTITGGPVGLGYYLSSLVIATSALELTDMFNNHGYDYRPNDTGGIIWHTEFMW